MTERAVGVVGKLPGWADFVRLGARGVPFEQLLRWLVGGAELAAGSRRPPLGMPSEGNIQAFVYRSGGSLLCGALAPSCDSVGRRVPVAAAVEVEIDEALGRHPELLPILFENVWAETSEIIGELQRSSRDEVSERSWALELALTTREAEETYQSWTQEIAVVDFLELVFGDDVERAPRVLAFVEEAAAPYRGVEMPETPLSLRLPLGASGGATVCFWLDLVRRVARWRRTVPSFFWSHDGNSGVLMLHLGLPPESALEELWQPSGACDDICDLVSQGTPAWQNDRSGAWAGALGQTGRSLAALLEAADFGV
jgi:type VI secretion system ImpM family protein